MIVIMKEVVYSQHLEFRLRLRLMPPELPKIIYQNSQEIYLDTVTGLSIAIGQAYYHGKVRELAVAFREDDKIVLITIHPLKTNQKSHRIASGRWRKL